MAEIDRDTPGLRTAPVTGQAQMLLHCDPENARRLGDALGIELSTTMLRATGNADWHALHLAPDEWLLIGPEGRKEMLGTSLSAVAVAQSLVDVSDRTLCIELRGNGAKDLLNAGCPLDLGDEAFPEGACTRTLFGKAPVMLWRLAGSVDCFRMHYARSYHDYVTDLIETAAQDLPGPGASI